MQISCKPHPDLRSVLTIFCEAAPWRDIHTSVFGRRPLFPQGCKNLEEFSQQFFDVEYQQAKNYAMRRLSLQAMLSQALVRSLKERLVSANTIALLIQELTDLGWINDEEWTAGFIRGQQRKKMGPRAIAQKLASKGIKGELLESALAHSKETFDQELLVKKLLETRYAKKNLKDFKEKQKVIASLMRRGFDFEVIKKAIRSSRPGC